MNAISLRDRVRRGTPRATRLGLTFAGATILRELLFGGRILRVAPPVLARVVLLAAPLAVFAVAFFVGLLPSLINGYSGLDIQSLRMRRYVWGTVGVLVLLTAALAIWRS